MDLPTTEGIFTVNFLPLEVYENESSSRAPLVVRREGKLYVSLLRLGGILRKPNVPDPPEEIRLTCPTLARAFERALGEAMHRTGRTAISIEVVANGPLAKA